MPGEPDNRDDRRDGLSYVNQVRENTRRYVDDLRAENERHKLLVSSLESERLLLENKLVAIQSELDLQIRARNALIEQMREVEGQRLHYAQDYAIIEEQNNNLANLYVATYGLHGTLDRSEVLRVIKEIIANLVGCEEVAIYELDSRGKSLELLASVGLELDVYGSLPTESGLIWDAVRSGKTYIAGNGAHEGLPHERTLTACVPLKIEGKVSGAIALFRLLGHKPGLEPLDFELFDLLASQASIALHTTKTHSIDPDEVSSES
jgi:hypothetical protein